jgi:hypothetical protein
MNVLVWSMPGVAVVVVLAVSIQGKHFRGTEDFSAPSETTALYARIHRNIIATGKQLHAKQRTKASTLASTNK